MALGHLKHQVLTPKSFNHLRVAARVAFQYGRTQRRKGRYCVHMRIVVTHHEPRFDASNARRMELDPDRRRAAVIQDRHIFQRSAGLHDLDDLRSDFLSEFLKPSIPVSAIATVRLGVVAEVEIQTDSPQ